MPETIAYVLTAALPAGSITAGTALAIGYVVVVAAAVYTSQEAQRKAKNAARDAHNDSLADRYVTFRSATAPQVMILGRQRVSGPMTFARSTGTMLERMTVIIPIAGHQIDGIEATYLGDQKVVQDSTGFVIGVELSAPFPMAGTSGTVHLDAAPIASTVRGTVAYGDDIRPLAILAVNGQDVTVSGGDAQLTGTATIYYQPASTPFVDKTKKLGSGTFYTNSGGGGGIALPYTPIAGTVSISRIAGTSGSVGDNVGVSLNPYITISGNNVYVSGSPDGANAYTILYNYIENGFKALIRVYTGAPGQVADPALIAYFPALWTAAMKGNGIAYAICDYQYSPDAFPSGLPQVSFIARGALCYDPRDGSTRYSENPVILARYAALSPLSGRQKRSDINEASVMVAANICDPVVTYIVGGHGFVRPIYRAGIVAKSGTRCSDVLDDLMKAAGGGTWDIVNGKLTFWAGGYTTPLPFVLDQTWLSDQGTLTIQPDSARADGFNSVTGKFINEEEDFKELYYPKVEAASYIELDGATLPQTISLNAVTYAPQAQQVVAVMMRDARQAETVVIPCNMKALVLEPFDNIAVTLERFGWVEKVFQVQKTEFSLGDAINVTAKETHPSIFALGLYFAYEDPAPNTRLRSPWDIAFLNNLRAFSGTNQLFKQADGTIQSRIMLTWDAMDDASVNASGGGVEVRYGPSYYGPEQMQTVRAPPGDTHVYLTDVHDGVTYYIQARARNALVNGEWTYPIWHTCIGKTQVPADVPGIALTVTAVGLVIYWSASWELDYGVSELRFVGGGVANWAAGQLFYQAKASSMIWTPAVGTYTVMVKWRDTSGNYSTTATSATITITPQIVDAWQGNVTFRQSTTPTAKAINDTWFNTANGNLYVWDGAAWVIWQAGNATFRQATAPTAKAINDTWFNTTDGRIYVWNGTAWVLVSAVGAGDITTPLLANEAATEVHVNRGPSTVIVNSNLRDPDGLPFNTLVIPMSFTPAYSGLAVFGCTARGSYSATGGSGVAGIATYSIQDAAAVYDTTKLQSQSIPFNTVVKFSIVTEKSINVTAGVAYNFGLYASRLFAGDNFNVDNREFKVEVIKR